MVGSMWFAEQLVLTSKSDLVVIICNRTVKCFPGGQYPIPTKPFQSSIRDMDAPPNGWSINALINVIQFTASVWKIKYSLYIVLLLVS